MLQFGEPIRNTTYPYSYNSCVDNTTTLHIKRTSSSTNAPQASTMDISCSMNGNMPERRSSLQAQDSLDKKPVDLNNATGITFLKRMQFKKLDDEKMGFYIRSDDQSEMKEAVLACKDVYLDKEGTTVSEYVKQVQAFLTAQIDHIIKNEIPELGFDLRSSIDRLRDHVKNLQEGISDDQISQATFEKAIELLEERLTKEESSRIALETSHNANMAQVADNANFVLDQFKIYDRLNNAFRDRLQELSNASQASVTSLTERVERIEKSIIETNKQHADNLISLTSNFGSMQMQMENRISNLENQVSINKDIQTTFERQICETQETVQSKLTDLQDHLQDRGCLLQEVQDLKKLLVKMEDEIYTNKTSIECQEKALNDLMDKLSEGVIALD